MDETRRTIDASDNPAALGGMKTRNNGRYNGNGRHWATPPDMGDSWCIVIGDGDVRLHVTASRRKGKARVRVIEESGVRR